MRACIYMRVWRMWTKGLQRRCVLCTTDGNRHQLRHIIYIYTTLRTTRVVFVIGESIHRSMLSDCATLTAQHKKDPVYICLLRS